MLPINPAQCRAARALLGWKQADLAQKAGIGTKTVYNFEENHHQTIGSILSKIRSALEDNGVIFLDSDDHGGFGVRIKHSKSID
jgi:DNA-binding XRE family transcriptional regulator